MGGRCRRHRRAEASLILTELKKPTHIEGRTPSQEELKKSAAQHADIEKRAVTVYVHARSVGGGRPRRAVGAHGARSGHSFATQSCLLFGENSIAAACLLLALKDVSVSMNRVRGVFVRACLHPAYVQQLIDAIIASGLPPLATLAEICGAVVACV